MRIPVLHKAQLALKPTRRRLWAAWYTARGRREDAIVQLSRIVPGMFRYDEIRLLYRTARDAPGPGDYAEIGSWKGRTAVVQALGVQDGGVTNARIYAIDYHQGSDGIEERIAREGSSLPHFRHNIRRMGFRDLICEMVMRSEEAARILTERGVRLRMVFIDGAHDEDSVRSDIRNFVPLVNPGGIVAFHDYDRPARPGVVKAYESELKDRVDEIGRASSLLVTQLRS
jgi:predicted O-methyltransferase YrrM